MMSPSPAWRREGNEGVRPGAHIEIVIDLQLHCLEGGRLFMTQSGALQTPDWISNRHFIYAFDRQSGHPIWANRPYPEVRLPLEKALNAYREDPNNRLPIFPKEPHTLLADGSAGSFATCSKNFGIDTFAEWLDTVQRSESPVILDEQAWRDIHIPDDHAGKTPETVCYGRSVSVWPSAALMRMEKRFWNKREDYDTQINIICPTIVCPTCSSRHPDGVVNCIECSTRLEPHTDQSMITDYMREREDAVRKNRQAHSMLLALSAGINRNRQRVRFEGQEEQRETISAASALRNKCKQMVKRADQRGLGSLADIVDNPIDAYNTSCTRWSLRLFLAGVGDLCRPSNEVSRLLSGPVLQARRDCDSDLRGNQVEQDPRFPHPGLRWKRQGVRWRQGRGPDHGRACRSLPQQHSARSIAK